MFLKHLIDVFVLIKLGKIFLKEGI